MRNLQRITSGGRLIPEIDGFRFLAILVVLLEHSYIQVGVPRGIVWPSWLMMPDGGTRGVFLFFTISGFILGLPFARRALLDPPAAIVGRFSYRAYFARRLSRLEPPYVLILVFRFILILGVLHSDTDNLVTHLFASLFYVHNVIFGTMSPISPPTWSLEVEVQFYLLAPYLASVFLIRFPVYRRALLVLVTLGFACLSRRYFLTDERLNLSLIGNFQYFSAGLLLCDFYVCGTFRIISAFVWDCLGVAVLMPLIWDQSIWTVTLFPFGALILYMAGLRGHVTRRIFATSWISIVGGMCYSIYLTHGTVFSLVAIILARAPLPLLPVPMQALVVVLVSLLSAVLVGMVFFVFVERPCMNPQWPQRFRTFLTRGYNRSRSVKT